MNIYEQWWASRPFAKKRQDMAGQLSLHCQVKRPLVENHSFCGTNVRSSGSKLSPVLAVNTAWVEHDEKRKSAPFQNERGRQTELLQRVERGPNHFRHRPCKRHEPEGGHACFVAIAAFKFSGHGWRHGQHEPDLNNAGKHLLENNHWVGRNNLQCSMHNLEHCWSLHNLQHIQSINMCESATGECASVCVCECMCECMCENV